MISLRWKLALAMVLVSSAATITFGVASYRSTEQRLMTEVDQSLLDLDSVVVARGPDVIGVVGGGVLSPFRAQYTRDGNVLRSTFPEPVPVTVTVRAVGSFTTIETSNGDYRVRTVPIGDGVMQVGRSLSETQRVLSGVRRRTALLLVLVALVAAGVGVLLADRITAPLRRLTAAADDVAQSGRPARGMALVDAGRRDEVGRLSAGFSRMLGALARSQEEQERLVQDAGHELRTPLTSLRTNLDTLARYPDIPAGQRDEIVADLQAEVSELAELVDEIVAVAGGGLTGEFATEHPTRFDLAALTGAVAERYARRTGREIEVAGADVAVVAERTGVQRALSCLIDNACKFDRSGGPIEVRVTASAGYAEVRVRDHGDGIADHELPLVFDRFHRAVEARTLPGSGLGLAIVRAVAERHGGAATAANHPEGGAVVGFTLVAPAP